MTLLNTQNKGPDDNKRGTSALQIRFEEHRTMLPKCSAEHGRVRDSRRTETNNYRTWRRRRLRLSDQRQYNRKRRQRPHHHFLIMRHATTRCNLERIVCRRYISNDFQPLLVSLHDTRRRRSNSVSDLFILMENEQKTTFTRAFEFTKPFLQSFNEQCVAHVVCQMAVIGAFKDVFGGRIQLVSSIRTSLP